MGFKPKVTHFVSAKQIGIETNYRMVFVLSTYSPSEDA